VKILDKIQKIQNDEYYFPYHYVSEFRNKFTQTFNDTWGINYVSTIEFIIDKLSKEKFNSLVDIGCGDGRLVKEIMFDFDNKNIQGVDYSKEAIKLANALNSNGAYIQKDITQDSDETFDIATLIEVFEHIPINFANEFVKGIYKHLKLNGILYVTVPHSNKPVEPKHYRHFTVETLVHCFEEYFEVIEVIPFESNSYKKRFMDRILTNRIFILNSNKMKNYLYKYYKNNLFYVENEAECNRIFIKFRKK
jgi:2-polyprenyl-3-methyl-5-hydroxy-6-metoxy-1,4-benzoquinol methylase